MAEPQEVQKARHPKKGEATAFGASYCRELDAWVVYWMPGCVPLGVHVQGFENKQTLDLLLKSLHLVLI